MGIVQQAAGVFTGTSFTAQLASAPSSANRVIILESGGVTVTTLAGWTLRTSQVNFMGHYMFDRAGDNATSGWTFSTANGNGVWYIAEIAGGVYDTSNSANVTSGDVVYNTPNLTPAAGDKIVFASLASLHSSDTARTLSGWTGGFTEVSDNYNPTAAAQAPMQGVSTLESNFSGATVVATTGTFSVISTGRSALVGSYVTTAGVVSPTYPPITLRAAGTTILTTVAVTLVNPVVPAGATTGDLSVLCVEAKPYTTTIGTPSGWTKVGEATNGTVASAADVGSMKVAMFVRESVAPGAIGNLTLTGADSACAVIHTYAKGVAYSWDVNAFTSGGDTVNDANYSATGGVLPVSVEDWVVCATAANTDLVVGFTAQAINGLTGATLTKTVRTTGATSGQGLMSTGNDSKLIVTDAYVIDGVSITAPTFTYTSTSSSSGVSMWLRLRQIVRPGQVSTTPERQAIRRAANW